MIRRLSAGLAAIALLLLLAIPVSAGGWATITADPTNPPTPNEGAEVGFGFTVLQHGVTPAGWVNATLVLENEATGELVQAKAEPQGTDGHFVATFTAPASGFWAWRVELAELEVESRPVSMTVLTPDGLAPTFDAAMVTKAIQEARASLRNEMLTAFSKETDLLRTDLSGLQNSIAALRSDRDALAAQVAELRSGSGEVPAFAVIALAILAGAVAGFAMAWLGRRSDVVEGPVAPVDEGSATSPGVLTTR